MRHLKAFVDFLEDGTVRKVAIDKERAKSLRIEAERKGAFLNEIIEKIGIKDENANDYVEDCYDIMMFLIRAKMYEEGYSATGMGSHEAEVSFVRNLGLSENDTQFLNQLRYFRNGILYYGKRLDAEYAEKVVGFLKDIYPKLIGM